MSPMFRLRLVLSLAVSAGLLSACARGTPEIAYDSDSFRPAVFDPEPMRPLKIVPVPRPLPLPGQLMPRPEPMPAPSETEPPAERVETANEKALHEPKSHGYVNAIQVYPFTEGALYRLYAAPERVSDIALQPGENLTAVSAGDTVRWVIGDTTSGAGETRRVHVLVKPIAPGLTTNLVITTDKRSYHLQLESTEKTAMAAVSWTYPHEELLTLQRQNSKRLAAEPIVAGLNPEDLRFRYEIAGDTPPWRPVRAFDDGAKVYIAFPRRLDQGEAPPLFVIGRTGRAELVNYRVRSNYYIVDRLFAVAELRLGEDPQSVVRITRTDGARRRTNR